MMAVLLDSVTPTYGPTSRSPTISSTSTAPLVRKTSPAAMRLLSGVATFTAPAWCTGSGAARLQHPVDAVGHDRHLRGRRLAGVGVAQALGRPLHGVGLRRRHVHHDVRAAAVLLRQIAVHDRAVDLRADRAVHPGLDPEAP